MTALIGAFFLALVGVASLFFALSLVGVDQAVAGSIAAVIVGGVPYIRESLDKQLAARTHPEGSHVLSPNGFALPPQRLVLYGVLMLFAAMQFASGVGGVMAAVLEAQREKLLEAIGGVTLLVVFPAVFLVGRWVGRRSVAHGLLTIFLIALLARTAATVTDFALLSREDLELYLRFAGSGPAVLQALKQIVFGVALFSILGALGYWRGRRQRLGNYLGYLLRNVPDSTRAVIVELAFDEASRVGTPKQPSRTAVGQRASQVA